MLLVWWAILLSTELMVWKDSWDIISWRLYLILLSQTSLIFIIFWYSIIFQLHPLKVYNMICKFIYVILCTFHCLFFLHSGVDVFFLQWVGMLMLAVFPWTQLLFGIWWCIAGKYFYQKILCLTACTLCCRMGRLQDSNAVLSHFNEYSERCYAEVSGDFTRNVRHLKSMKSDLDHIFTKLRCAPWEFLFLPLL